MEMILVAYKVLYRKYRPDCFKKIIGQRFIVNTLKSSIETGNFSHAYIFTGPRGTGKTSTAKILAKAINCENLQNGEPCGECESCKNFNSSPDIIEIDAASNNGVDEIRELRNNVTIAPSMSKNKIYIIDEVHMLSPGAFNALLKTLEEPPEHVIFILATTEIYKVPITILSRCQRYDFKKIEHDDMISALKNICNEEKIEYEDEALNEIYELSDGCLRDALSILDQLSKSVKKVTQTEILDFYSIISTKSIQNIIENTFNNNIEKLLEELDTVENSGMNAQKFIKKIINYLEKLAIDIKLGKEKKYDFNQISKLIINLNECYTEARTNENVFSIIKLSFLELIKNDDKQHKKEIKEKVAKVETILTNSLVTIRVNNCFVGVNKKSLNKIQEIWDRIEKDRIQSIDLGIYNPVAASETYAIFKAEDPSLADLFNIKAETIEKQLQKNNITIKVIAVSTNEWNDIKEKYKINIQNNVKYEYMDEPYEKQYANSGEIQEIFEGSPVEIS